jgi:hypothetical protein
MIASLAYGFALAVTGGRLALRCAARAPSARTRWIALAGIAAGAAVAAAPIQGVPLAGWFAGIAGDLSITSLVLLAAALAGLWSRDVARWLRMPLWLVALAAGVGLLLWLILWRVLPGDLYGLGYAPGVAGGIALGAVIAAAGPHAPVPAAALAVAAIVWWAGAGPSPNLWDVILDPWLVFAAWIALGRRLRMWLKDSRGRLGRHPDL